MTAPEPTEREREIARNLAVRWVSRVDPLDSARGLQDDAANEIAAALARYRAEVVAAEREACARVADKHVCTRHCADRGLGTRCDLTIAAAIRARG